MHRKTDVFALRQYGSEEVRNRRAPPWGDGARQAVRGRRRKTPFFGSFLIELARKQLLIDSGTAEVGDDPP